MKTWAVALITLATATSASWTQQCTRVGSYEGNTVAVSKTADGLVTFRTNIDVNTDGALQSYKIDDLGFFLPNGKLQTNSALNTICNGAKIRRPDHSVLYDHKSCGNLIREFKRIRDFGWLRDGENYVDFYAIARIPDTEGPAGSKNRGKPCEKDGYYVSQVARALDASKPVCDPEHWVDALRIPAIVLPLDNRMKATGVQLHDLAIIRLPNGKQVGAIVGDTNPNVIGEATVITNMKLSGMTAVPANYRATVALQIPAAEYIVFPGTKGAISKLSNDSNGDIQSEAQKLSDTFKLGERAQPLCR